MRRTIRSGKVVEKSQFWLGPKKPRKTRRKGSSSQSVKDSNMRQAHRALARILNCNFTSADLFVTFSYDSEHLPRDPAEALKVFGLFLRRLKRKLKKAGDALRCVWVTADKDPKTGRPVRLHHHMVVGGECFEQEWTSAGLEVKAGGKDIEKIWGQGVIYAEPLREQDDYTQLATYLVRQAVAGEDVKKWHVSQGLDQPVVVSETVIVRPSELRAPGGAVVQEVSDYDRETGTQYMRYIYEPEKRKKKYIGFDWRQGEAAAAWEDIP